MYIRDLKKIKKEIEQQEQLITDEYTKLKEMKNDLQTQCHHPKQYVKTEESYYSGSYLNMDYTNYTPYCTLCGTRGETETVTHGSYC